MATWRSKTKGKKSSEERQHPREEKLQKTGKGRGHPSYDIQLRKGEE